MLSVCNGRGGGEGKEEGMELRGEHQEGTER